MYTILSATRAMSMLWRRPATSAGFPQGRGRRNPVAAERATGMALEAIQCLGGNGYMNEYPTGDCCVTPNS